MSNVNVPIKTFGGKQFWGDVRIYGGWRIQRNVFSGHFRLLDRRDVRRAWGTREECEQALEEAKRAGQAVPRSKRLCVLLHGLGRSKDAFRKLKKALEEAGYEVYGVNYPSTQFGVDTFAEQVKGVLDNCQGDFEEMDMVTHSLGGIVARRVLSRPGAPKVKRLIMLGPPNQGAVLADVLSDWWPFKLLAGPAGQELQSGVEHFAANAGVPHCEYAVIAGGKGDGKGWNPLIPGDDDGVVGVTSTRLNGMKDFLVVPALHSFMARHPYVIQQVLAFLKTGTFSAGLSRP